MSMNPAVLDRLFERLTATYGAAWDRSLGAVPLSDAKSVWGDILQNFGSRLDDIAWALDSLPERPPNAIEFRNLCRRAPAPDVPRLPEPKADPARVAAELRKLAPIRRAAASGGEHDGKAWARRLIARHEAGEGLRPIALRFAREALKLHLPQTEVA